MALTDVGESGFAFALPESVAAYYADRRDDRPPEYIFKNEIANQLFLKKHNPDISAFTTEFRIGKTRLDVVVINGTSTCYEIKTDRDEVHRLPSQLNAACGVFEKVYVVTSSRLLKKVVDLLESWPTVGLYALGSSAKLKLVKRARSNVDQLIVTEIFSCLRQSEYLQVLRKAGHLFEGMPNTKIYEHALTRFKDLSGAEAHAALVYFLRKRFARKGDASVIAKVPYEVRSLYLNSSQHIRQRIAYQCATYSP